MLLLVVLCSCLVCIFMFDYLIETCRISAMCACFKFRRFLLPACISHELGRAGAVCRPPARRTAGSRRDQHDDGRGERGAQECTGLRHECVRAFAHTNVRVRTGHTPNHSPIRTHVSPPAYAHAKVTRSNTHTHTNSKYSCAHLTHDHIPLCCT